MSVTEDTTERPVQRSTIEPSSGLFIGFLVATAPQPGAERPDRPARQDRYAGTVDRGDRSQHHLVDPRETELTTGIRTPTAQVAKNAALIIEVDRHVSALTAHAGLDDGEFPPDAPPSAKTFKE